MKKILITGGSGFFGYNAARYYLRQGYSVVACSSDPAKYERHFAKIPFVELNVLHPETVVRTIAQHKPDVVIHAAAYSQPMMCEQNPKRAREINVGATQNVFNASAALNIPFVFLSTDLVFDGGKGNYNESDIARPIIEYGRLKLEAERMIMEQRQFAKWSVLRCSLMYANGMPWTNGFPQFAVEALKRDQSPTLFLDQFRTPIFVEDIAVAVEKIVQDRVFGELFHVAGAEAMNRVEFVQRYCSMANIPVSNVRPLCMRDVPNYTTRVRDVTLNAEKLMKATGWRCTPLEISFKRMLTEKR